MADEKPSATEEAGVAAETAPKEPPPPERPVVLNPSRAGESPSESHTKGLLRDAIQKVMEEIEYHEREAKKHLQQAEALRIDLRDSFSFLQERGEKAKPTGTPPPGRSGEAARQDTSAPAKDAAGARPQRGGPRKKPGAGKNK